MVVSITKNLAKASAQRLQSVIVEYEVLCTILPPLNSTTTTTTTLHRHPMGDDSIRGLEMNSQSLNSWEGKKLVDTRDMLVTDIRSLLKRCGQEATGKPHIIRERLQKSLEGLPEFVRAKLMDDPASTKASLENNEMLERQIRGFTDDPSRNLPQSMKNTKSTFKHFLDLDSMSAEESAKSSIRAKYMGRISQLKKEVEERKKALEKTSEASDIELPDINWRTNEGALSLLRYIEVRGLSLAVIPPITPSAKGAFLEFVDQKKNQIDYILPISDKVNETSYPDANELLEACSQMNISKSNIMVLGYNSSVIRAGGELGALTCWYKPKASYGEHVSSTYTLQHLDDFQYIVEEFNGISFRDRM